MRNTLSLFTTTPLVVFSLLVVLSLFRTTNNLALAAPHVPYSTVSQPSYSFAGQTYSIYSIALFALDKGGSRVPNIATPLPMTTIGSGNGKGKQGNKKWLASSDLPIG